MITNTYISRLQETAAAQWGMFTIVQASAAGVSRQQVARLLKDGRVERTSSGVYRFKAGDEAIHSDIKAAWMSIYPEEYAYDRLAKKPADAIVTGTTATRLYEIGNLHATPYTFMLPRRKQTSRPDMKYHIGTIEPQDVTTVQELPCVKPARIIADLVRFAEDPSLIHDVAIDFETNGYTVDTARLAELLSPLAKRNGYPKDDGASFVKGIFEGYGVFDFMVQRDCLSHDVDEQNAIRMAMSTAMPGLKAATEMLAKTQALTKAIETSGILETTKVLQKQLNATQAAYAGIPKITGQAIAALTSNPQFAENVGAAHKAAESITLASVKLEPTLNACREILSQQQAISKSLTAIEKLLDNAVAHGKDANVQIQ